MTLSKFWKGIIINSTAEVMKLGMNCLIENLGVTDTERFISTLFREKSDYTLWRKRYFDNVDLDSFLKASVDYAKEHLFFEG